MTRHAKPSIGSIVHYVSYGTPNGEYESSCRAAVVTETTSSDHIGIAVLNPTGLFFDRTVAYHDGAGIAGDPECPDRDTHGDPFHYCACGWMEPAYEGGTWHWPEM